SHHHLGLRIFLREQQWKPSMYSSITPICFASPLLEKPVGKVRMNSFLAEWFNLNLLAVLSFCLELFG
ncbi:hypothetical protein FD755_022844, partial [Muntiacus reevesi]